MGGPMIVREALAFYFNHLEGEGRKSLKDMRQRAALWIFPTLGNIQVGKLTRQKVENWRNTVANSAPKHRAKLGEKPHEGKAPESDDEKRARKATANRVLSILKAALSFVRERQWVECSDDAWALVKPFRKVDGQRMRFLSIPEQVRLVNACPDGFKQLVQAGLFTGARFGELCRLNVGDFNAEAGTLWIAPGKSGKGRHVVLDEEAQDFFKAQTAGRATGDSIFQREGWVDLKERKKHGKALRGWKRSEQFRPFADALEAAKIDDMVFHELRHTAASRWVNAGVPLAYVASQLGHTSIAMVQKHYGHLCPDAKAHALRSLPRLGITGPAKVENLTPKLA
jgi:integrase